MALQFKIINQPDMAKLEAKLNQYAHRGRDTFRVMEMIGDDMLRITGIQFSSGGRRGGGQWRQLKPDTVRKKGTTEILRTLGAKAGYGIGNDALYKSVTVKGAPFQIFNITRRSAELGTTVPGAAANQEGSPKSGIPARPFLRILPSDVARWNRMITEHLIGVR